MSTLGLLIEDGLEAVMHVVCSWCGKYVREKEPLEDESISHGICKECCKKAKIKNKRPKERSEKKGN
jgi:hypothetical protein